MIPGTVALNILPGQGAASGSGAWQDTDLRLVCFPHAGGGPASYRTWQTGLRGRIEVWGARLSGLRASMPPPSARGWPTLIDTLTSLVLDRVPPPYALFGHSLGSLVAFEVARNLELAGRAPTHLAVSGRQAPDEPARLEVPCTDDALLDRVDQAYGGGIPAPIRSDIEALKLFLPALRADLELAASYVFLHGRPLTMPVTALAGDEDTTVSAAQLEQWAEHTIGDFASRLFPGGHFYLAEQEQTVLDALCARLLG